MVICMYKHFLNNVKDNGIRSILEFAMDISNRRVTWVIETFNNDGLTHSYWFLRHDLFPSYTRAMMDIANYAEDGTNIMIENGWFEEPPRVVDRRNLINTKH